jgi:hypothetical protein
MRDRGLNGESGVLVELIDGLLDGDAGDVERAAGGMEWGICELLTVGILCEAREESLVHAVRYFLYAAGTGDDG